ncbi:MAG: lactonase family protein [Lachnospiraceae bacterium]
MKGDRYVAYVSTYTQRNTDGILIYDVDIKNGRMEQRDKVTITNSTYLTISHNLKYVYSTTDLGIESFRVLPDGGLKPMNQAPINGMRGSYISTDYGDHYLFVAGYHDGKITVLKLNEDGSIGEIVDEIFHAGFGSISERNFHPHVSCVRMTRDNKYLCAADLGLDHVKIYRFEESTGKLKLAEVVRCDQGSAPRLIKFRRDGKFAYILNEMNNKVEVYSYKEESGNPVFTKQQEISTLNSYHANGSAACALKFSIDNKYLFCSNAGDNSIGAFEIDNDTGLLEKKFVLPVSGDYPKDLALFPDTRYLISLNHGSNTMTFFKVDLENNTIVMNGPEIKVRSGNCIVMLKVNPERSNE